MGFGGTFKPCRSRTKTSTQHGPDGLCSKPFPNFYCDKICRFNHFQVYDSVAFSSGTKLGSHHHYLAPDFPHPKQKPCPQLLPAHPPPPPLATTDLLSFSTDLPILGMSRTTQSSVSGSSHLAFSRFVLVVM